MVGATGTIGRATARVLLERGCALTCFLRRGTTAPWLARAGAALRSGDVDSPDSIIADGFRGETFDAVVSCMASRGGAPREAWAVDHLAHLRLLEAAAGAGIGRWVQLSAICLQKPRLAFQQAKLAFEASLMASGLAWSIVRPTAYFKSLSGQVERVRAGKPYLVFGDGTLTRCKPIGDRDTAEFLAGCLEDPSRQGRILPIGGPGPALSPREQGELLFALAGRPARFRHVPVRVLDGIAAALGAAGRVVPPLADKAEFARIARYYATESMLVWDPEAGRYDAEATPSTGRETLGDHYARLLAGEACDDRGEHAVF